MLRVSRSFNYNNKNQIAFEKKQTLFNFAVVNPNYLSRSKTSPITIRSIAKGAVNVAKEMLAPEALKTTGKVFMEEGKDLALDFKSFLTKSKEIFTNKAIVNGKIIHPLSSLKTLMVLPLIPGSLAIMSIGTLPSMLYGLSSLLFAVSVGGFLKFSKKVYSNPLEIAKKMKNFHNKTNPLKMISIEKIKANIDNLREIVPLRFKDTRILLKRHGNFLQKEGFRKNINLAPPRKSIWISEP